MEKSRAVMRWLMAAFYLVAGIGHLLRPDTFALIVPDFVPKDPQAATITVRQVLSHTTGLPNWRNIKQPLYISPDGERGQVILRRIQRHVPYC